MSLNTIDIVNIGTGNIANLVSAIEKLDINFNLCSKPADFNNNKIILPGVASFPEFMEKIKYNKIDKIIFENLKKKIPILGICAGFQVLFEKSYEKKKTLGLGLLKGEFKLLKNKYNSLHDGWNSCEIKKKNKIFKGIKNLTYFYFCHSYILKNFNEKDVITFTKYNKEFPSSVSKKNIFGVQFHPEKSQDNGLKVLKNFSELLC